MNTLAMDRECDADLPRACAPATREDAPARFAPREEHRVLVEALQTRWAVLQRGLGLGGHPLPAGRSVVVRLTVRRGEPIHAWVAEPSGDAGVDAAARAAAWELVVPQRRVAGAPVVPMDVELRT